MPCLVRNAAPTSSMSAFNSVCWSLPSTAKASVDAAASGKPINGLGEALITSAEVPAGWMKPGLTIKALIRSEWEAS